MRLDADLKNFVWDLGKEGFVLQLISLAGLHCNAVSWGKIQQGLLREAPHARYFLAELSRRFKEDGMRVLITYARW